MTTEPRCYNQYCGLARALDIVGERWTLLMVRELLLGPRRYKDFITALPGLTTNLLAKRLRQLEDSGIIERTHVGDTGSAAYMLTSTGAALEPVIMELGRWGGHRMATPKPSDRTDPAWPLISMKRRYKGQEQMRVELEIDERVFTLGLEGDYLRVEERASDAADLRISGAFGAFQRWWFKGVRGSDLIARGTLVLTGSKRDFLRFRRAFEGLA